MRAFSVMEQKENLIKRAWSIVWCLSARAREAASGGLITAASELSQRHGKRQEKKMCVCRSDTWP